MIKIMPKKTFLISLLLILLSTGCKSVRIKEKDAEKIEYTRIDSIFIERTFPLHDTIFVNIPLIITEKKECDSICQKELNRWLLSVEASKKMVLFLKESILITIKINWYSIRMQQNS